MKRHLKRLAKWAEEHWDDMYLPMKFMLFLVVPFTVAVIVTANNALKILKGAPKRKHLIISGAIWTVAHAWYWGWWFALVPFVYYLTK